MKYINGLLILLILLLLGCQADFEDCVCEPEAEVITKTQPDLGIDLGVQNTEKVEAAITEHIDDIARWISGLKPRGNSIPKELIEHEDWQKHANKLNRLWEKSMEPVLEAMDKWSSTRIDADDHLPVFYPFSGPDILNALHLYPHSNDYLLIALENEGLIPPLPTTLDEETLKGLKILENYVSGHVLRNFFITYEMGGKTKKAALGDHTYTGVSSVILFFLVRSGYEIISIRNVSLSSEGALVEVQDKSLIKESQVIGVEIKFKRNNEQLEQDAPEQEALEQEASEKRVIFFKANISDTQIAQQQGLIKYILSYGQYNSIVKAASYLMYYSNFDSIRNLMLSRSHHIISDDTGIPYHFFKDKPEWAIDLYGTYSRPNPGSKSFAKHCQPNLKSDMKAKGKGGLPFRFGYYLAKPNLLFATRQTEIIEPELDFDFYKGTATIYKGDKLCHKGKQYVFNREARPKKAPKKAPQSK